MEQNKVRIYIFYAIGEIFLVVIGILIALQVNNWNEERINSQTEQRYLQSLIQDLQTQVQVMENNIINETIHFNRAVGLIEAYNRDGTLNPTEENRTLLASLWGRTTFVVRDPTFSELIATGNIQLISNERLRNQVIEFYQNFERVELIIQKNNDAKDNTIMPVVYKYVDIWPNAVLDLFENSIRQQDVALLDSIAYPSFLKTTETLYDNKAVVFEIMNMVKFTTMTHSIAINLLTDSKNQAISLIAKIEEEL